MVILAISEKNYQVSRKPKNTKNTNTLERQDIATILYRIPYAGIQGETLIKNLVRKLKRHLDKTF